MNTCKAEWCNCKNYWDVYVLCGGSLFDSHFNSFLIVTSVFLTGHHIAIHKIYEWYMGILSLLIIQLEGLL